MGWIKLKKLKAIEFANWVATLDDFDINEEIISALETIREIIRMSAKDSPVITIKLLDFVLL
jgi:hypothetical protein